jgi:nucleoside-diphosphate-sugar epimerase
VSAEKITWAQFFQTLATSLERTIPAIRIPASLAYAVAALMELGWKAVGASTPPPLTRFGVSLLTVDSHFDIQKAYERLGFAARVHHKEGLRQTLAWIRDAGLLRPGDRIRNDLWA